jgi:Fibrobacter succinogenes major domain (Fib_succ_major).
MQLLYIFRRKKMLQKKIKLFAVAIFLLGITGCQTHSIKDVDGNKYKTVTIGTQVWMAENLKTTKYNDGTEIPLVTNNDNWAKLTTPAYSWYDNDTSENKKTYGALYNWYSVNTNKLCPKGWHVPTDGDWMIMVTYLKEGESVGGSMKEVGTNHWKIPNTGATNKSGFTALPGGYRSVEGIFNYIGIFGYWWSSTEYNNTTVFFWYLRYKYNSVYKDRSEKYCGFSVRCIMD